MFLDKRKMSALLGNLTQHWSCHMSGQSEIIGLGVLGRLKGGMNWPNYYYYYYASACNSWTLWNKINMGQKGDSILRENKLLNWINFRNPKIRKAKESPKKPNTAYKTRGSGDHTQCKECAFRTGLLLLLFHPHVPGHLSSGPILFQLIWPFCPLLANFSDTSLLTSADLCLFIWQI